MKAKNRRNGRKDIQFYYDQELVLAFRKIHSLEHLPELYMQCLLVRFFWGTAVRINEARMLKIEDCGPDFFTVREGKNKKSRDVEPTPEFKPYYQAHVERCRREGRTWFFWPVRKYGAFRQAKDDHMSVRALRNWWREIIDAAGIRYLPPHDGGRNTWITWYAETMQRQDLQDQVGHEDYRTTELYYRGSIPGRRFSKPEPEWKKLAQMPEAEEKLRVIQGGKTC